VQQLDRVSGLDTTQKSFPPGSSSRTKSGAARPAKTRPRDRTHGSEWR